MRNVQTFIWNVWTFLTIYTFGLTQDIVWLFKRLTHKQRGGATPKVKEHVILLAVRIINHIQQIMIINWIWLDSESLPSVILCRHYIVPKWLIISIVRYLRVTKLMWDNKRMYVPVSLARRASSGYAAFAAPWRRCPPAPAGRHVPASASPRSHCATHNTHVTSLLPLPHAARPPDPIHIHSTRQLPAVTSG